MFNRISKKPVDVTMNSVVAAGAVASMSMGDVELGGVGKKNSHSQVASEMNESSEDGPNISLMALVVYAVCAFSFVVSWGAILLEREAIVIIAMLFPIVLAPYAAYQRKILSNNDGMRTILNKLRREANNLGTQNDVLHGEVGKVEEEVNNLERFESNLNDIAASQGYDVKLFMNLVKENKETLAGMKESLQGSVMADVMEMVLVADRDEDFQIDPEEVNALILRMKNLDGVDFDEGEFRKVVSTQRLDVNFVILLVKDMMDDSSTSKILKVNLCKRNSL
mmetsp:Transcript_45365/g.53118  ORF Transcript_45365/g.53118 Transcript_45365/m.53118 type:complete len:280 (+) Transcript_45365:29-868(+)